METTAEKREPDSRGRPPMSVEHGGKRYRILFAHWDNRHRVIREEGTGRVVGKVPQLPKALKRNGLAQTTCYIHEVVGQEEEEGGKDLLSAPLAIGHVRCSPKDHFNRAHGRWYALERALLGITDDRLRRALRKGYYSGTAWRPDGRDGFKIDRAAPASPQLIRVGR